MQYAIVLIYILVLQLKGLTPNGMLPSGILDGQVPLRDQAQNPTCLIKTFEDAKNLDRVNEKMPQRRTAAAPNAETATPNANSNNINSNIGESENNLSDNRTSTEPNSNSNPEKVSSPSSNSVDPNLKNPTQNKPNSPNPALKSSSLQKKAS